MNTPDAYAVYYNEAAGPLYFDEPPPADSRPMPRVVPLFAHPPLTRSEVSVLKRAADAMGRRAESSTCVHVAGYLVEDAAVLRGIAERLGGGE